MSEGKSSGVEVTIRGLYGDLSKLQSSQDFEKAIKVTNKILNLDSKDSLAFHSKIISFLRLAKFKDALRELQANEIKFNTTQNLAFETAYALYRLERPKEALKALEKGDFNLLKIKELYAQIQYKLEAYEESYNIYRDIVKNISQDDFEMEHKTNMMAAMSKRPGISSPKDIDSEDIYELSYNKACLQLAQGDWTGAEKSLIKADNLCVQLIKSEELGEEEEEEIINETAVLKVQLAYSIQMQGREKEAQAIYVQVLKNKPSDIAMVAVASNNIVVLNRDQSLFDSRKRIKTAMVEGVEHKLPSRHLGIIARNNAILTMYTNQVESCVKLVEELKIKYPSQAEDSELIVAGVLSRCGKLDEAISLLTDNNMDLSRLLTVVHLVLERKDFKRALSYLEQRLSPKDRLRPGILSAMVTLNVILNDRASAARLLKAAVKDSKNVMNEEMARVRMKTAEFHLKGGEPSVAAESLEELLKLKSGDQALLAQLVLAYAKFNLPKALEVSKELPEFSKGSVDVEALESSNFFNSTKKVLKTIASPGTVANKDQEPDKKIKKKTKKKKLPKNYNPDIAPDPERWLPKRERSTFKKAHKRDRRKGDKFTGAQGTSLGQSESYDYSGKKSISTPKSPVAPQGPKVGPRQQQKRNQQAKKKKKKGF